MSEVFILDNSKDLKYGAMPWLMAYMTLSILKFRAILLSGNIAESVHLLIICSNRE